MLPADVTFLSADPAPSGNTGQTYNWNLASLNAGESFVIEVNVSTDAMGTIINTAQVSSDTSDLLPDNNEDSVEKFYYLLFECNQPRSRCCNECQRC